MVVCLMQINLKVSKMGNQKVIVIPKLVADYFPHRSDVSIKTKKRSLDEKGKDRKKELHTL